MKSVNSQVADRLAEVARVLEAQGANIFRVGAYRFQLLEGFNPKFIMKPPRRGDASRAGC